MSAADADALIVGAGPAGSSVAILLARAGWRVVLIEKQRFPRRKVCGECIAATNLPLLDALGIGAAVGAAAGPALERMALLRGAASVVAPLPPAGHAHHRWGRALGRETLDTLLLAAARAAGAEVLQPWSVQALDGAPGDWTCTLQHVETKAERTLRAPVAIAAHGSWETLKSARPAARRPRRPSDLLAFKANFIGASLSPGVLPVLAFDGGYGGMVVADGGVTTLACCVRRDRLDAWRRDASGSAGDAVEQRLADACAGVGRMLVPARRDGAWLAAGPLEPGVRLDPGLAASEPYRIGNAAGEAHPIIGEGMSMALQSAWLLAAELLRRPPPGGGDAGPAGAAAQAEAGARYAARWRQLFAPRLRLAAAFAHLAMRPAGAAPLLALASAWPGLLTHGARFGGKARCAVDAATMARLAAPRGGAPTA